ncbi:hypothetical protein ABN763_02465 [Spongiivirga sp. MCCC 1A20706]|uniref:hypothetical protein n=1 Tax=Spongiivirga sp. MCCC 1A20706 TaxID=3160963 RepID=UPI0039778150
MHKRLFFILILFAPGLIYGQVDSKKESSASPVKVIATSYAKTAIVGEQHASFSVNKYLGKGLYFETRGQYDTYLTSNIFKTSFTFKKYFGEKIYLFSGYELEMEQMKSDPAIGADVFEFTQIFRGKITNGIGYDNLNRNINIEFKHDLNFSKNNLGSFGTPNMLSLKGTYKF